MSYSRDSLRAALRNQLRRLKEKSEGLERRSRRLSNFRLAAFLGGMGLLYVVARWQNPWLFGLALLLFAGGFAALVILHRKVDRAAEKFRIWGEIRRGHLNRMELNWQEIPWRPPPEAASDHPFARDLNLVGEHSLLHLADTATFEGGRSTLTRWLLARRPPLERLPERLKLVRELRALPHFRDRLTLRARTAKRMREETDWSMKQLQEHLEHPRPFRIVPALLLLGALSGANLLLLGLWLGGVTAPWVILSFVLYLLAYNYHSGKVRGLFEESYQMEKLLSRFHAILGYLEEYPFRAGSALEAFCEPFHSRESTRERPSRFLRRILRLSAAGAAQKSQIGWLLLNAAVPWDLFFTWKLERYKKALRPRLNRWMKRFYRLEALSSLANLAWLNPGYSLVLPSEAEDRDEPPFLAKEIGHPLIPASRKVTNDVVIDNIGDLLLITGSNMSGKSTFLRTLGINLALCFAGGPVNAAELRTFPFRLFSTINIADSLERGLSHFYAEVKRLRRLLELLEDDDPLPLFFVVDEIYKGTNNRERMQGSEAFLKTVAGRNGVGLVSTHDLELASLEEEIPSLTNWHFEETIRDGRMSFEYKLKPGPCPTTNALRIMEMEGLPT